MLREALNADGMSLTIFCGDKSTVGIGVLGTWVGTLTFYGSVDGLIFFPLSATPFPSGTPVSSTTANGSWFADVKNLMAVKVVLMRTSGTAQVVLSAAVDGSWQDAFLTPIQIANSSAATSGVNTLTQASQANRSWNLTSCEVCFASPGIQGGAGRLTIYDGTVAGNILFEEMIMQPSVAGSVGWKQVISLPTNADGKQSLIGTLGNAMTIVLRGINGSSIINTNFTAG